MLVVGKLAHFIEWYFFLIEWYFSGLGRFVQYQLQKVARYFGTLFSLHR